MTTTFFTACNRRHWPFVAPYAASMLHHNADAVVEICVEDVGLHRSEHAGSIEVIDAAFPDRFFVHGAKFPSNQPVHSIRFLEEPHRQSEYTYIGDVDILVLDTNFAGAHLANMTQTGLPYSNIVRTGRERLSGLQFTRTDVHYPLNLCGIDLSRCHDENLLYQLIVAKGLPLPSDHHRFCPVHGLHLSLHRPPVSTPGLLSHWNLGASAMPSAIAFIGTALWQEIFPTLHPAYPLLMLQVLAIFQARVPDTQLYPLTGSLVLYDRSAAETFRRKA